MKLGFALLYAAGALMRSRAPVPPDPDELMEWGAVVPLFAHVPALVLLVRDALLLWRRALGKWERLYRVCTLLLFTAGFVASLWT